MCAHKFHWPTLTPADALDQQAAAAFTSLTHTLSSLHYILSGSFKQTALYLLAFDPSTQRLSLLHEIPGFGPHQYIALSADRSKAYTTSWALPPQLHAWDVQWPIEDPFGPPQVQFLDPAPITAVSSYITVEGDLASSAGGPTGEIHRIQPDGRFGEKIQQVSFVDGQLDQEDKTRVALRYGSHAVEYSTNGKAFIPHLSVCTFTLSRDRKLTIVAQEDTIPFGCITVNRTVHWNLSMRSSLLETMMVRDIAYRLGMADSYTL